MHKEKTTGFEQRATGSEHSLAPCINVGVKLADAKSARSPLPRNSILVYFIYTCRVGDGNQREVTADFSLESLGAPRITLLPQFKLMI